LLVDSKKGFEFHVICIYYKFGCQMSSLFRYPGDESKFCGCERVFTPAFLYGGYLLSGGFMHPNIVEIGPFVIHWYGLMLSLSFLIGIYLSMHRAEKRAVNKDAIMDLTIVIVLCAIVGSRLLYVVTHIEEFDRHWIDVINPVQSDGTVGIGGLSMLGGVVLSLAGIFIFSRLKKIPILILGDIIAPAFALGIALTRIGCFMVGCCFGEICHLPWGVVFPEGSIPDSIPGLAGQPIHPTQLYSSLYGFIIFATLLLSDRKRHSEGFVLGVFFIMYGIARFCVDFVRYYNDSLFQAFGYTWTINQAISLFMFLAGLFIVFVLPRWKRGKQVPEGSEEDKRIKKQESGDKNNKLQAPNSK
jgi:phosphatidylglycerol:prolipoprotein diacylglycerol transferase